LLRLSIGAATDPGRVRAVNEDKALVSQELVAVADGMGGHVGGEIAARTAIEALRSSFARNGGSRGLLAAVEQANRAVYDQSVHDRNLRGMGTTLTAAAVVHQRSGDKVVLVNVGDSRAYLLDGRGLVRLTQDHSLVEEMVRRGELTPAEAAVHPHRHIVTRVLGIDETIEVDAWELEPEPGARLLLCSDGLTNECDDAELEAVLAERRPAPETARELVARALSHGGSDNITAVVVDFEDGGGTGASVAPVVLGEASAEAGEAGDRRVSALEGAASSAAGSATSSDPATMAVDRVVPESGPGATAADRGASGPPTAAMAMGAPGTAGSTDGIASAPSAPLTAGSPPGTTRLPTGGSPTSSGATTTRLLRPTAPRSTAPPTRLVAAPPGADAVRVRHERIMTFRVAFFVLLLVGVLGGAAGFVGWFVKASYYVGIVDGRVAILEGRPGGFLWFKPIVVERTTLAESDVFAPTRPYLEAGMEEPTLATARRVLGQLLDGSAYLALPTGSSGQANGVPIGSTLVPISSPIPTVATLPPTIPATSTTIPASQLSKVIAGAAAGVVGGTHTTSTAPSAAHAGAGHAAGGT
jgi:protein phosphatase